MKFKHLVLFTAVLALLVVAVFLKNRQKPAELTDEEYRPLGIEIQDAAVSSIEIGKGKDAKLVELRKGDAGDWRIPTFLDARADKNKIDQLMKALREAKGELRAKEKALYADFGIGDDTGFRIAFLDKAGNPLQVVHLGTKKTAYSAAFVRHTGSDNVFYTDADPLGKIGVYEDPEKTAPTNEFWAELHLLDKNIEAYDSVMTERFQDGKALLTSHVRRMVDPSDLSKKKWGYVREGMPFALDAEKIKEFLRSFETRPASKALDPKAKDYGFATPKWKLTLHRETGEDVVLTAGAEDTAAKGVYMQVSTEPVVFLFPNFYFTTIDIDDSKFVAANPFGIDPDKIEKIFVHTPSGEVDIAPKEDKRTPVTTFVTNLKNLTPTKLMFDPARKINASSGQLHWIEIKRAGSAETIFLDVEGKVLESGREFLASKRGANQAFVINETTFTNLFGNLEALKKSEPVVAAEPAKAS
jgi:hypothetical protein